MRERLEELRAEIRAERISYGEIAELQTLVSHIEPGDTELLQWAAVPESGDQANEDNDLCPGGCGRNAGECVRQSAGRDFCGDADYEDLDELDKEFGGDE